MESAHADLFVGRAKELAVLESALGEALAGRGRVVTLSGEPGIGKTRLARELAERAREKGAAVLWGGSHEGEWAPAYGPFVEALTDYVRRADPEELRADLGFGAGVVARIVPAVRERIGDVEEPVALEPDEERFRLFDAVSQFSKAIAIRAPLALLIDDLHWADGGTIALLRHVARVAVDQRIVLLGTFREGELEPGHPLTELPGMLRRESVCEQLVLKGLSSAETLILIRTLATGELPEQVILDIGRHGQGNPFFIREIVQHLIDEGMHGAGQVSPSAELAVPEGIRQLIGQRLRRLSPDVERLLTIGAAFSGPFPLGVAAAAASLEESAALQAIDDALRAKLIHPTTHADTYDFSHALIRQTLYRSVNPARRARLHRRLAHAMERTAPGAAADYSREIADQYFRSRDLPGAEPGAERALTAADRAEAAYGHEDAASMLQIALDLLPRTDPRRARLLARRGLALIWSLELDEAARACLEASERIAEAESRANAAQYLALAVTALNDVGGDTSALALTEKGLDLVGDRRDVTWAVLKSFDIVRQEAEDPASLGIALDTEERREVAGVLRAAYESGAWWPLHGPLVDRAGGGLGTSFFGPLMVSKSERAGMSARGLTRATFSTGAYRDGVGIWSALAQAAEREGRLGTAVGAWTSVLRFHVALGEFSAAIAARARAGGLAKRLPLSSIHTSHLTAAEDEWRMARDIDWGQPMQHLGVGSGPGTVFVLYRAATEAAMARIHARMGREQKALERLPRVVAAVDRAPVWAENYVRLCCDATETLWLTDTAEHANLLARNIEGKIVAADYHYPMCDARLALARLCALRGDSGEAAEWFAKARNVLDEQGARPLRAIVDYDEALMYVRRGGAGDRERAGPLLEKALAQFRAIDMPGWIRRAEALLGDGRELASAEPEPPPAAAARVPAEVHPATALLRNEGDFWSVSFGGKLARVKASKGLEHLAVLLRHPGREFHVADLSAHGAPRGEGVRLARTAAERAGLSVTRLDDAGPVHDAEARSAYKRRLAELREEIEEARSFNDIGRASTLEAEMEALLGELRAGTGLGGRSRKTASPVERARLNVTRAIRTAVRKIGEHNRPLAEHLGRSVKTGIFCSYDPDPQARIEWRF